MSIYNIGKYIRLPIRWTFKETAFKSTINSVFQFSWAAVSQLSIIPSGVCSARPSHVQSTKKWAVCVPAGRLVTGRPAEAFITDDWYGVCSHTPWYIRANEGKHCSLKTCHALEMLNCCILLFFQICNINNDLKKCSCLEGYNIIDFDLLLNKSVSLLAAVPSVRNTWFIQKACLSLSYLNAHVILLRYLLFWTCSMLKLFLSKVWVFVWY